MEYLCRPSEASTRFCVIPGGYPPQDWQSLPCAGEELDSNSELEFLNKMPNPGILESRDLSWGDIYRFHVQCLKIVLNVSWDIFCNGMDSLISNTASCFEFWIGFESYEYFIKINPTSYVCWKSPCEFHLQKEVT